MPGDDYAVVGRIVKTHGLKGEVSVATAAETSFASLIGMRVWFVPPPVVVRSAVVSGVRPGPKGPLLSFDNVKSIDDARPLVGCEILAPAELVPDETVGSDSPDYSGYRVTDETRGELGTITETILTGANDVWVVGGAYGEVLIPVIDDVVSSIDDGREHIVVRLLPGLLPDEQVDA